LVIVVVVGGETVESYEILKQAISAVGAKQIAHDLSLSLSLVYRWCSETGEVGEGRALNPLDRILHICRSAGTLTPIEWLCAQSGGYFVKEPDVEPNGIDDSTIRHTQTLLGEFSELLQVISVSIADQDGIDSAESERIRQHWIELQSHGEMFVRGCELGLFQTGDGRS
jgi:hypothetical protein